MKMIQANFANSAKKILENDQNVLGLAVAGSWLKNEIDEFSDLDLIVVTKEKIGGNRDKMLAYAKRFNGFLSGFTGEHVGEPRLLICLYEEPLLHVDIKFLTMEECHSLVETPIFLIDKNRELEKIIIDSSPKYPYPDYQWIEDRFWIWIHYALLKIGRGEYFEAYDFLGYLRSMVLGPLLHIKNNTLPRGVRKVETELTDEDLSALKLTIAKYDRNSLLEGLQNVVLLYRKLRIKLFNQEVAFNLQTENKVMEYFHKLTY